VVILVFGWLLRSVDGETEAVAGFGDGVEAGLHAAKVHDPGIGDGLAVVVVEDG
jgi:hypothetical protein